MSRVNVLGVSFDNLTQVEFLQRFVDRLKDHTGTFAVTANPEIVMYAREHHDYLRLLQERADFITADGVGILVGAKMLGQPLKERVTGYDLMMNMLALAAKHGWRVYMIGAKKPVVTEAVRRLQLHWPSLNIVGYRDGYFDLADARVRQEITALRPQLVFAALGFPKQEEFLTQLQPVLPGTFLMGVGGSFDVLAGTAKRAPTWMQKARLEWFYRLLRQPSRIGRMLVLPQFVVKVANHRRKDRHEKKENKRSQS